MESNYSPEIPDRGETDIPGRPSGVLSKKQKKTFVSFLNTFALHQNVLQELESKQRVTSYGFLQTPSYQSPSSSSQSERHD